MRLKLLIALTLLISLVIIIGGCSSGTTTTSPGSTSSPTGTSSGSTFGQMANAGTPVYASKCALCHGDNGQGGTAPAIIGTNSSLGKFNTAKGLLDYISTAMPANAPGSLSRQEYSNVLSHLLVRNNKVSSDTAFNESGLEGISLK